MEKSRTEFLQECQAELAALKERIAALETRIASLAEAPADDLPAAEEEVDFTGIEIGAPDLPEVAAAPAPAPAEEEKVDAPQDASPAPDPDTMKYPWRTDRPGMAVKNIRSGISLYDRALFIGTLFKEDFALYDQTIAALNAMDNLEQAVQYIRAHFPDWNLGSDAVYHFIMSVRKKLG